MTTPQLLPILTRGVTALGISGLLAFAPIASAQPQLEGGATSLTIAQPAIAPDSTIAPGRLTTHVTDISGVLTPEEAADLESSIQQLLIDHHKSVFVVFMPTFGDFSNTAWVDQAVDANGGGNTFVLAIATQDRQFGLSANTNAGTWTESDLDDIEDAIFPALVSSDWAGAGVAAVEEASYSAELAAEKAVQAIADAEAEEAAAQASAELEAAPIEQPVVAEPADAEAEETTAVERPATESYTYSAPSNSSKSDSRFWPILGYTVLALLVLGGLGYLFVLILPKALERLRKKADQQLADSRLVALEDGEKLRSFKNYILQKRVAEVLPSTDALIKQSRDDLNLVVTVFGSLRTRSIQQSSSNADNALQKAFQISQTIDFSSSEQDFSSHDPTPLRDVPFLKKAQHFIKTLVQYIRLSRLMRASNSEKQTQLITILSLCGQAEKWSEKQVSESNSLRNQLADAGPKISSLTQESVSVRTRIARVKPHLLDLRSRYSAEMLTSINDNVTIAESALERAEAQLAIGRDQLEKPIGQRAGVLNAIFEVEKALALTGPLLLAVEQADNNIAAASQCLGPLIDELEAKITEVQQLKDWDHQYGAGVSWEVLDPIVEKVSADLVPARANATIDPLSTYSSLLEIEPQLSQHLPLVRKSIKEHKQKLQQFDRQFADAQTHLQTINGSISIYESVITPQTRIRFANSMSLLSRASFERTKHIEEAQRLTSQAVDEANQAREQLLEDIGAEDVTSKAELKRLLTPPTTTAPRQFTNQMNSAFQTQVGGVDQGKTGSQNTGSFGFRITSAANRMANQLNANIQASQVESRRKQLVREAENRILERNKQARKHEENTLKNSERARRSAERAIRDAERREAEREAERREADRLERESYRSDFPSNEGGGNSTRGGSF